MARRAPEPPDEQPSKVVNPSRTYKGQDRDKPLSLQPLEFETAMRSLLSIRPETIVSEEDR